MYDEEGLISRDYTTVDAGYVLIEAGETPARAEIGPVLATWAR